jgi:predicted Zn-dependent peptidase
MKLHRLKNGLRILVIPHESSETVAFNATALAGSMFEEKDEIGVAHFLEHMVLDATQDYPDEKSLTSLIEDVGGRRHGTTTKEFVEYHGQVLPRDLERAFIFLSQILQYPLLKEKDIVKHKGIIEQEIERFKSDPEKYIPRIILKTLYPKDRLAQLNAGDVADIKTLNREKLLNFFNRRYVANNFILVIYGKCEEDKVLKLAEKYFGAMRQAPLQAISLTPDKNRRIEIELRPTLRQTVLERSFHGFVDQDPRSISAEFIAAILSRGKLSRLSKRIRDELGLAYVIQAYHYSGIHFGNFGIYAGVDEHKVKTFLKAITQECQKLIHEPIQKEEWHRVQSLIEAGFLFRFQEMDELARFYARSHSNQEKFTSHQNKIKKFKQLTPKNIQSTAEELFSQPLKIAALGSHLTPEIFQK